MKLLIHITRFFLVPAYCLISYFSFAQKDSIKNQTIDIISSYKPGLKNAAKINFSAAFLPTDSSQLKLIYNVPALNLFYSYKPISLKPLALQPDTNLYLGVRNYVKAGFGNYTTPYLDAGFSLGDGKKNLFGFYANYISSKGKFVHQDYSLFNVKSKAHFFNAKNQINIGAGLAKNHYNLYGYDHDEHNFSKSQIQQRYQDVEVRMDMVNTVNNEYNISYAPSVQVNFFSNIGKLNENTLLIKAPVEKKIQEKYAVMLEAVADISSYHSKGVMPDNVKFTNNVLQLSPSAKYMAERIKINAGLSPTWDNSKLYLLPNIYGEVFTEEKTFSVQAGITGRYIKNTFKNLNAINPYMPDINNRPDNTIEREIYGEAKATLHKHFNVNVRAGFITYNNFALFINDTATDNKSFKIVNETKANNLRMHGNVSYIKQDKLTVTAGLTLNGYTGFNENEKPWNTIPVEFTGSLRWWPSKQLLVKGDLYIFKGSNYIQKNNTINKISGGTDLSIGCEFSLNKMFSLWADLNNIFSNTYQRWPYYPVYGLNVLAGARVVF